jgi:glycosyltransferase involved in cell wall biosynthesis
VSRSDTLRFDHRAQAWTAESSCGPNQYMRGEQLKTREAEESVPIDLRDGQPARSTPKLTVIVPVFNEAEVLPEFHARLANVLRSLDLRTEVIYVDDGSRDQSSLVLESLRRTDASVGVVRLSRNFGKELAMSAGLHAAEGDCVVLIDADLQHPPEAIPAMIEAWRAGSEVVSMRRSKRDAETVAKKFAARVFYFLLNRLSDVPMAADVSDFRLLSRRVVDALNSMPERNRYMKGLFAWVGFSQATLEYDRAPRAAGKPQQSFAKLCALALEGITSFSVVPLRLAFLTGLISAGLAFAMTMWYLVKTLLFGDPVGGFPTLIVSILSLGGLNLLGLGVIGEYLGRLLLEAKQRPLYLVEAFVPPRSRTQATHRAEPRNSERRFARRG